MDGRWIFVLLTAFAVSVLPVSAEAQQHKATRLGNPATRFTAPVKSVDQLQALLSSPKIKADMAAVLDDAGWKGNPEDISRAAAKEKIGEIQIPSGTRLPFMASRKNKKPYAMKDVLWAGRKPIDAFTFEFSSNCIRYRFVIPEDCGNFWVEEIGKDDADPKCTQAPAPVVSMSGPGEICVDHPAEYSVTVKNPRADKRVTVSVNGKEIASGPLSAGTFSFTFPGAPEPGAYEVKAVSGGVSGTTTVHVKPCPPEKSGLPIFFGLYGGKERLVQDNFPNGHCAGLMGFEVGIQPMIAENTELEAGFGLKLNVSDTENTSVFGDLALNRILGSGFVGGGVSAWDLTKDDTRAAALLVQGGFDLTSDGVWQLVAQGRVPFEEMKDIDSNYQVWGGFRFRPDFSSLWK